MLIRISGGIGGIREYLETGRKKGRDFSRDDLDERVVLSGNLVLVDKIINAIKGKGEKYLHITLSFKEDHVDSDTLRFVAKAFEHFAMSAYRQDEYAFYAEAHLPRVKSYPNRANGNLVERKPHIHVVIPKINLLTQRHLDPFGLVLRQVQYLEAFQEDVNLRFGFASPRDNPRIELVDKSDMIGRYKGDTFAAANREFKSVLLDEILAREIRSLNDLEALLAGRGEVRRRNSGTDHEYLNVKLDGEEKGINLKEHVFSSGFLDLPLDRKIAQLQETKDGYIDSTSPLSTDPAWEQLLAEWKERRSRELKYISSGRRKEYALYNEMSENDKLVYLLAKEREFYEAADTRFSEQSSKVQVAEPISVPTRIESITPKEVRAKGNLVGQYRDDRNNEVIRARDEAASLFKELKRNIDVDLVLHVLATEKGLELSKYKITEGKDGTPRILCGQRNLNVADFMTKEMHMPWCLASDFLCLIYSQQVRDLGIAGRSQNQELWANYEAFSESSRRNLLEEREVLRRNAYERYIQQRDHYKRRKAALWADPSLLPRDRKTALSLLQTEYLGLQEIARRTAYLDIARFNAANNKSILSQYCEQRAIEVDEEEAARTTSSKSTPQKNEIAMEKCGIEPTTNDIIKKGVFAFSLLHNSIAANGDVTYSLGEHSLIKDAGRIVWALDESAEAVEACLRLAVLKYGQKLHVTGTDSFRRAIAEMAVEKGLAVEFDDEWVRTVYDAAMRRAHPREGGVVLQKQEVMKNREKQYPENTQQSELGL
jgi:SLT domain-containing protein